MKIKIWQIRNMKCPFGDGSVIIEILDKEVAYEYLHNLRMIDKKMVEIEVIEREV